MSGKPIAIKAILPGGMELNLTGPDFSKLKCEQPLPDTAIVLQRIEDEGNAGEILRSARAKTMWPL